MNSSDNKELNMPPRSEQEAYRDMIAEEYPNLSGKKLRKKAHATQREDLVNQLKRRAKELKEEKEKRNDPVQRYMRTARRVNAKTGGLLGNPSRMRNR
jgi:uncharacterized membrane protein YheB (UPF0754 family)